MRQTRIAIHIGWIGPHEQLVMLITAGVYECASDLAADGSTAFGEVSGV
jgi:hypothetical protein